MFIKYPFDFAFKLFYSTPVMDQERRIDESILVSLLKEEQRSNPDYRRDRGEWEYRYYLDLWLPYLAGRSIDSKGFFKWYDMCCGEFNAGKEFISFFSNKYPGQVEAHGIDIDTPSPDEQIEYSGALRISRGNAVAFPLPTDIDLITCVNGLYLLDKYLGFSDVCAAIENWYNSLSIGGQLLLMNESPLRGYRKPFDIGNRLQQQLGEAVEIQDQGRVDNEYHKYIKIIKYSPNTINLH